MFVRRKPRLPFSTKWQTTPSPLSSPVPARGPFRFLPVIGSLSLVLRTPICPIPLGETLPLPPSHAARFLRDAGLQRPSRSPLQDKTLIPSPPWLPRAPFAVRTVPRCSAPVLQAETIFSMWTPGVTLISFSFSSSRRSASFEERVCLALSLLRERVFL